MGGEDEETTYVNKFFKKLSCKRVESLVLAEGEHCEEDLVKINLSADEIILVGQFLGIFILNSQIAREAV